MAFISSSKNSSGNVSTASTTFPTGSVNVATISQDTASAYIASQSNGSQIKFKDINQIDEDDMEEMDIKWSMALLSMRADKAPRSHEKGRKESYRQGSKTKEKTPKALMAIDGVGWDWSYMKNEGEDHALKNTDSLNNKIKDLKIELSEANNYIYHYKLAVAQLEGRLTGYKEREVKYIEKIRTLEMYRASNLKSIKALDKELEEVKVKKDGLDGKLADDANILLRTPWQHNMYSIDLNNIVPHRDLTCLVAKASTDECILWHMRIDHLNVKTMNKLVRNNLVRGLPTKVLTMTTLALLA
nr:ribonuclease H-like domain-containing protein [Tanacetum cinerariifolium]